jgi:hypothetical protein
MFLINGQPWIDLSSAIDTTALEEQKARFAYIIARYPGFRTTSVVGSQSNLIDNSLVELNDFAVDRSINGSPADLAAFKALGNLASFFTYCKFMYKTVGLNQAIYVRTPKPGYAYSEKHLPTSFVDNQITPEFKFLNEWVDSQNIFDVYGRMILFINEPGVSSTVHRDYPNPKSHKNEFIWITLDDVKQFFIYDLEQDKKHFFTSNVTYFDNANWHGSMPSQFANFSIRIDGIFNESFLRRTGMYEHFRNS